MGVLQTLKELHIKTLYSKYECTWNVHYTCLTLSGLQGFIAFVGSKGGTWCNRTCCKYVVEGWPPFLLFGCFVASSEVLTNTKQTYAEWTCERAAAIVALGFDRVISQSR